MGRKNNEVFRWRRSAHGCHTGSSVSAVTAAFTPFCSFQNSLLVGCPVLQLTCNANIPCCSLRNEMLLLIMAQGIKMIPSWTMLSINPISSLKLGSILALPLSTKCSWSDPSFPWIPTALQPNHICVKLEPHNLKNGSGQHIPWWTFLGRISHENITYVQFKIY